jgi:hemolysin D
MRLIGMFAISVLIIAIFGRLDIVVSAKGKLVPDDRVKIIQPAITGVIRHIYVEDGQRILEGALLMDLDQTQAQADAVNSHEEKIDSALAGARAEAVLKAQENGTDPIVSHVDGAPVDKQDQAQILADGVFLEYRDKKTEAEAELLQHKADLESTLQDIERLKVTAPMARQQANDYKALVAEKYVSQIDYLDKEQAAIQQEHDIPAKTSYAEELKAAITAQQAQVASITSQFRREQLDALNDSEQKFEEARNAEIKAVTRQNLLSLRAPVEGTVQQLSMHTIGGVVTAAQSIMEIVPDDALEVEANVENKDIGFVRVGQDTIVKIDAFPYTRYGYLHGKVQFISNDAVDTKKDGLTFIAHIKLSTARIKINDQWITLTPGMAVTAEIKTGNRSVAGYFLNPLVQTARQSMRER